MTSTKPLTPHQIELRRARDRRRNRPGKRFQRACIVCGKAFLGYFRSKTCGPDCRRQLSAARREHWPQCMVRWRTCQHCGQSFCTPGRSLACQACRQTKAWRNRHHPRSTRIATCDGCGTVLPNPQRRKCSDCVQQTRRARKRRDKLRRKHGVAQTEPYTIAYLAKRDNHRCGICRKRVDLTLKVPNPRAATVDHIVPISAGGQDTRDNVRLAHFRCNVTKQAGGNAQLRLIG